MAKIKVFRKSFSSLLDGSRANRARLTIKPNQEFLINGRLEGFAELVVKNKQPMDIYVSMYGLKSDLDLYAKSRMNWYPFASSTKTGTQPEVLFTRQVKGNATIFEIRQNFPLNLLKGSKRFNLRVSAFNTSKNPNMNEPGDPLYARQWYLFNGAFTDLDNASEADLNLDIGAPEAWNIHTGSKNIITAVIDSGVDLKHPDLVDNIWINEPELNGKEGEDDDGNGYEDDVFGWKFGDDSKDSDFLNSSWEVQRGQRGEPDGAPRAIQMQFPDSASHGTHVAGIIGAKGNNRLGITGINWDANIMALNVDTSKGGSSLQLIIEALHYALDNGAKVINLSVGGRLMKINPTELGQLESSTISGDVYYDALERPQFEMKKVLRKARRKDALIVAAVGNAGAMRADVRIWDQAGDLDQFSLSPWTQLFGHPNLIAVASVDPDGRPSPYTSFGHSVDIAAPGGNESKSNHIIDPITGQIVDSKTSNYGIISTVLPPDYGEFSDYSYPKKAIGHYESWQGTSMAAPVVSGSASLIWSKYPDLSAVHVKRSLLDSARTIPYLLGYVDLGRSLDLGAAMRLAGELNESVNGRVFEG